MYPGQLAFDRATASKPRDEMQIGQQAQPFRREQRRFSKVAPHSDRGVGVTVIEGRSHAA
jgi:hypothetical protein